MRQPSLWSAWHSGVSNRNQIPTAVKRNQASAFEIVPMKQIVSVERNEPAVGMNDVDAGLFHGAHTQRQRLSTSPVVVHTIARLPPKRAINLKGHRIGKQFEKKVRVKLLEDREEDKPESS